LVLALRQYGRAVVSDDWGVVSTIKRHPIISGVYVVCGLTGIVLGLILAPDEWEGPRAFFAGLFAGLVCAIFITAQFMIEAAAEGSEDDDGA